jgi:2-oxoglutarate ferredoxin oxidoreductase subunit alpha
MASFRQFHNRDVSLVLCGPAGSGIQTVEHLLSRLLKEAGYHVFATKEYMSRVRGGQNSTTLRVGSVPVRGNIERIDLLIPLHQGSVTHVRKRLSRETTILTDPEIVTSNELPAGVHCVEAPLTQLAKDIGNKIYSNIIAVGLVGSLFGVDKTLMGEFIRRRFVNKDARVIGENLRAMEVGAALGDSLVADGTLRFGLTPDPAVAGQMLISGDDAVGLGAIAGGCNFIGAYPMSPSTGVLTFLAQHGERFGVVVEQAEDEIAGINMALGAWYAGARAIASTSGGGFALMTEGLSLCAMIESPLVVHLAQRPGPATGLPTRTEQGDLDLALYAGHGEFPRAILAPGTLQQAFALTAHAFHLADRTQCPVFVMTDQYFVDTYYNTERPDVAPIKVEHQFVKTEKTYRRFEFSPDGLSPRGIPGYGEGPVVVDSDEHDEAGHITEDLDLRVRMVDKRRAKYRLLENEVLAPTLSSCAGDYATLVVCWGSTFPTVQEALERLGRKDTGVLHFGQLYPLHPSAGDYLRRAKRVVFAEGNAGGQFAALVKRETGFETPHHIRRYDGLQFTVEGICEALKELI